MLGRYCSYLLPMQLDGTFQIQVNGRFLTSRCVTLHVVEANGCHGGMGLRRRRRKATSALMNACQHELPLDVAIIIRKKVGEHSHCTAFHFT